MGAAGRQDMITASATNTNQAVFRTLNVEYMCRHSTLLVRGFAGNGCLLDRPNASKQLARKEPPSLVSLQRQPAALALYCISPDTKAGPETGQVTGCQRVEMCGTGRRGAVARASVRTMKSDSGQCSHSIHKYT